MRSIEQDTPAVSEREIWQPWPVSWTAVWVGALAAIALAFVFGLIGVAVGAHKLGMTGQITKVTRDAVVLGVLGSFFSFAVGGWVAASIGGIRRTEPAMLHGAISWLVALPLLIVLLGIGAGASLGGWYGGLVGAPAWVLPSATSPNPDAPLIARNAALTGVTAILVGLMGSVIGGWMGSGEPMTLASSRSRGVARRVH